MTAMQAAPSTRLLLDAFPLVRSRSIDDASERIGCIFSPHRLELRSRGLALDGRFNQVRLCEISLNVLRCGAEVLTDPGRAWRLLPGAVVEQRRAATRRRVGRWAKPVYRPPGLDS